MLLGLIKSANGCMLDSPKVVYFWRIRDGCSIKSEESAQLRRGVDCPKSYKQTNYPDKSYIGKG
uniref:Putative ovule protein n=1 Tax=Solanum chacoense TaxID=4108 RepID=A0A0V0IJ35_SOLCH